MTTRRQVAEAAGVSVRTVSNVVNGFERVAPETRARVLEAIGRLGYRPSEVARSLRRGRSGLVGLMLPELDTEYFAELTRAFVEHGTASGLTVVIDQTDGDRDRELAFLRRAARGGLFDAIVLSPLALDAADVTAAAPDQHVVLLGENRFPGFDKVMIDNRAAARETVAHLTAQGRTRIAAIGAQRGGQGASEQRLEGYRAALEEAGLPREDRLVARVGRFTRGEGAAAMAALLESRPDAVFCFTDPLALGAMRVLHDHGLTVPREVAVAGFDDIEGGRYSVPSLTSVSPDKHWIARTALDRVARRLAGDAVEPEVLIAPHRLIVRESSVYGGA